MRSAATNLSKRMLFIREMSTLTISIAITLSQRESVVFTCVLNHK